MAFQSLYRRFRPQRFVDVRGQDHISHTLRNAVRDGRVSHAYLFSGPRGTGKTSTARILAKALNCANPDAGEPCGVCTSCVEIAEGRSLDVLELDAASNRGVDAMRDLVSRASLGTPGRWKVYIVDEVHMLTTEASNTLLKTLEEPPGHVIFVLATTEPQKVLPTIRSRTQHFEFHLLSVDVLADHLRWVAEQAGLDIPDEVIALVAKRGAGSARDALSKLDQVAAAGGLDDAGPSTDEVVEALCERDIGRALVAVAERIGAGHDPRRLAVELLEHLRQAFLATVARGLVGLPDEEVARMESQASRMGRAAIVRAMEVLGDALVAMRDAPDTRVLLEVSLVRLCRPEADVSPAAMLERIERLERRAAGSPTAGPSAAPPLAAPMRATESQPSRPAGPPASSPQWGGPPASTGQPPTTGPSPTTRAAAAAVAAGSPTGGPTGEHRPAGGASAGSPPAAPRTDRSTASSSAADNPAAGASAASPPAAGVTGPSTASPSAGEVAAAASASPPAGSGTGSRTAAPSGDHLGAAGSPTAGPPSTAGTRDAGTVAAGAPAAGHATTGPTGTDRRDVGPPAPGRPAAPAVGAPDASRRDPRHPAAGLPTHAPAAPASGVRPPAGPPATGDRSGVAVGDQPPSAGPPASRPAEGPAAAARLALGGVRNQAAPAQRTPPQSRPPDPPTTTAGPPGPPRPAPSGPPAAPTGGDPASAPVPAGGFPTRDDLTLAWGDTILPALPPRARARFRAGRFVDIGDPGLAGFALPTPIHRERCAEVQGDVEQALAGHFGRRVPLKLLVEAEVGAPPADEPDDDEQIDPRDLRDAPSPGVTSPVDHVMQAFEGATLVEE